MTDMTEATEEQRINALADHTGDPADEYDVQPYNGEYEVLAYGREEWLVLTDDEATALATSEIEDSLWTFKSDWLTGFMALPEQAIVTLQEQMSEGANEVFAALIRDHDDDGTLEDFVEASISADGRGHFLSSWDGNEVELHTNDGTLYAFRVN